MFNGNSAALFDVFDNDNPDQNNVEIPANDASTEPVVPTKDVATRKRSAERTSPGHDKVNGSIKRQKQGNSPQPVVTDAFEQEASRQVAPSSGLQSVDTLASQDGAVILSHQVRHQVALPPNYSYVPISQHVSPDPPARTYPFTLDPFQRVSINSIERNESVLVSAHTSAGKTVVAEYAIAQSLRDKQRVIYTSPIKVCYRAITTSIAYMTGPE